MNFTGIYITMKQLLLFIAIVFTASAVEAQPGKRPKRPVAVEQDNRWRDDSLLEVKRKPQVTQTANTQNQRTRKVNNTKLDDLKNPFDTGKVVQTRQTGTLRGATQTGANTQTRRIRQPREQTGYLDSALIKSPKQTNFSWGATHPGSTTQNQRTAPPPRNLKRINDSLRTPAKKPAIRNPAQTNGGK